jgi:pectate lyase
MPTLNIPWPVMLPLVMLSLVPAASIQPTHAAAEAEQDTAEMRLNDQARLEAVREFADQVLRVGRDTWGDTHSPLFADGVNVQTLEPAVWRYEGNEWIISNFASQQHLLRTLIGLTELTGDSQFRVAAEDATRHMFEHYQDESGLLYWGGHAFVDLKTNTVAIGFDSSSHELKSHHPFYELFWQVNPQATERMLKAIWNAHVQDWSTLDMNRHGPYGREVGDLWNNQFGDPEPFFEGRGLTFINAGSDLIYAATSLYRHADDDDAWTWGRRLAHQYVKARHPETGLGVYQYSQPEKREEPTDDADTRSGFGDRAARQFGPEFGDVALEGNMLVTGRAFEIYGAAAVMQLTVAEQLGDEGRELLQWTVDGLRAYAQHAHDPEQNIIRPLLADGTDLTGHVLPRDGYYGSKGTRLEPRRPPFPGTLLVSYARAYRLSGDAEVREMLRHLLKGHDLGDIGPADGSADAIDLNTRRADAEALIAILELHRAEPKPQYLQLARRIGDNILDQRFHNGFFVPSDRHVYSRFDAVEPLALLKLEATIRGTPEVVPTYVAGSGYIQGTYNGHGRTYDTRLIWNATAE